MWLLVATPDKKNAIGLKNAKTLQELYSILANACFNYTYGVLILGKDFLRSVDHCILPLVNPTLWVWHPLPLTWVLL